MSLFRDLIPVRPSRLMRREVSNGREQFVLPAYQLKHGPDAYGLEVFVPGVEKDGVEIELDQGELVVTARRHWKAPEDWTEVFRETNDHTYRLRVDLNDSVNAEKINAEIENGVLRVTLPKADAFKPRKIAVN